MTDTAERAGSSPLPAIANDIVRRAVIVSPLGLLIGFAVDRFDGLASVGYGLAIVVINFLLSAYLLAKAVQISYQLVASVALGGFMLRMLIVGVAVWAVLDSLWTNLVLLGLTIIISHLGLLAWELKYVSASMAHPGLKPKSSDGSKPAVGYR